MAKKTSSSAKKNEKKSTKQPSKLSTKQSAKQPVKKEVKKAVPASAASKKKADVKPVKKVAVKAAAAKTKKVDEKIVNKNVTLKSTKKEAPAKKMKTKVDESELASDEVIEAAEIETPEEEVAVAKAEKSSKIKPIRVEKGNSADEKAKWAELSKKYGKEKAVQYKMSEVFAALSPIQHKTLGWGFILSNDNDRLEVLFESGIRMLISNYKS